MLIASRYDVRPMTEADISQVVAIERESFPSTWPQTAYKRELANRLARYLVVVDRAGKAPRLTQPRRRRAFLSFLKRPDPPPDTGDLIIGYVGVWLMVGEAHIVAVAVRPECRRRGLGELLLGRAIELAFEHGQEVVTLEVRSSNSGAQTLYSKYGFINIGVRRRYYSDNGEDALIMSTPPIRGGSFQERLDYLKQALGQRWQQDDGSVSAPEST